MLTALLLRLAPKLGFVDAPGERKVHTTAKPMLGGVAVYFAFIGVLAVNIAAAAFLISSESSIAKAFPVPLENVKLILGKHRDIWAILAGSFIMFIMGVIDDRKPLPPLPKLIIQIAATLPLIWAGVMIHESLPFPVAALITIAWVVFITNAFNFIDNMDGLCGGVAAICLCVFALNAYLVGDVFLPAMFIVLAGAIVGFLRYNWFPSRIFLGDGGALSIGYLIGSLSILSTYFTKDTTTELPVLMPLIILGVPIFDSLSVYLIRLREGRPLWTGDTSHFSHRLVALGLSQRQAVLFIYLVTLAIALAAFPLRYLEFREAIIHTGQVALVFVIIAFLEGVGSSDPNRNRPNG